MEKLGEVTDALLLLAAEERVKQEDAANGDGAKVCGLSNVNENGRLHCLYRRFSQGLAAQIFAANGSHSGCVQVCSSANKRQQGLLLEESLKVSLFADRVE